MQWAWWQVTSQASVARLVTAALGRWGRVDNLVNNAAVSAKLELQPMVEISSTDWDRVLAVNTRGPFECMKAIIPAMQLAKTGSIINIAAGTAIKGSPGLQQYVASKGAVIAMTRAAARELGSHGIRVNCVAPGLTMSENTRANPSWTDAIAITTSPAGRSRARRCRKIWLRRSYSSPRIRVRP